MNWLVPTLSIMLLVGCASVPPDIQEATYEAVYLVRESGQLPKEELQAHPEVIATSSFDEFKHLAEKKTALWIDINATEIIDKDWLNQEPQKFYPIVLVGSGNALCAFRDTLGGFGIIEGPYVDCAFPPQGFSVWMREAVKSSGETAFLKGYEQVPAVQEILEITTPLLSK